MNKYKGVILTILFFLLTAVVYVHFIRSIYFQTFLVWTQQNIFLYTIVLFCLKVFGIVYPPIPGGLLTLGSIPLIGWKLSYFIDFVGSMTGASIAYFLGKKYGYKFLTRLFDVTTVKKVQSIKIKNGREIEAVFVLRILTGSSILDILCYAAGLIGIKYENFIIGSILSHLTIGIPVYYTAGNILNAPNAFVNILVILSALAILYKVKGRYLE